LQKGGDHSLAHVIFSSVGSAGDVLPFLRIGEKLRERGHEVSLISHCCYRTSAEEAGFHFRAIDNEEEYGRFVSDEPLLNAPRSIPEFLRRHSLPKVPFECAFHRDRYRAGKTLLVTRDMFDTAARISAEQLDIPRAVLFIAPSQITTWTVRAELFRTFLVHDINRIRGESGLAPVRDWDSWLAYPEFNIALWPDWFAATDGPPRAGLAHAGFLLDDTLTGDLSDDVQRILNNDNPPVLITGGTGMYLGRDFYAVSAEACRLLNRSAILVTQHDPQVPKDLPEWVRRFSYLPFGKVMPRVRAVIHHGGRGTMSCALAAGVPQLILAMGADRPDNASRLQRLGVAESLPPARWKPEILAESLHRLTSSPAVSSRCRELAVRTATGDAAATACDWIEAKLNEQS
jgi:UDP:flavonoid glycosyltransferase YjiC (YdhE family)